MSLHLLHLESHCYIEGSLKNLEPYDIEFCRKRNTQ